jgi:hypothetical protein
LVSWPQPETPARLSRSIAVLQRLFAACILVLITIATVQVLNTPAKPITHAVLHAAWIWTVFHPAHAHDSYLIEIRRQSNRRPIFTSIGLRIQFSKQKLEIAFFRFVR